MRWIGTEEREREQKKSSNSKKTYQIRKAYINNPLPTGSTRSFVSQGSKYFIYFRFSSSMLNALTVYSRLFVWLYKPTMYTYTLISASYCRYFHLIFCPSVLLMPASSLLLLNAHFVSILFTSTNHWKLARIILLKSTVFDSALCVLVFWLLLLFTLIIFAGDGDGAVAQENIMYCIVLYHPFQSIYSTPVELFLQNDTLLINQIIDFLTI